MELSDFLNAISSKFLGSGDYARPAPYLPCDRIRRFTGGDLGRLLRLSNFLNSIAAAAARQADLEMMNGDAWAKSGSPSSIAHGPQKIAVAIFLNAINSSQSREEVELRGSSDTISR